MYLCLVFSEGVRGKEERKEGSRDALVSSTGRQDYDPHRMKRAQNIIKQSQERVQQIGS